jgi:hypothetical protein
VVGVVVGGGGGVVVGGGGGGDVVGGEVGGGLVGGGLVGAGLLLGLAGLEGADVGRVVVEADELDGVDVGVVGAVTIVPDVTFVRLSVPFVWTVNQMFKNPCPPACDSEWSFTNQ